MKLFFATLFSFCFYSMLLAQPSEDVRSIVDKLKPGEVYVPNSFTPNGDGKNDFFGPYGNQVHLNSFKIMNRWGEIVFESDQKHGVWNGSNSQGELPVGTYYWTLEYTTDIWDSKIETKTGFVMLTR